MYKSEAIIFILLLWLSLSPAASSETKLVFHAGKDDLSYSGRFGFFYKVSINLSSSETIRNLYFLKERKIFVLTADVENRGYLDTLKEIAEQKKDCGVKVFMDKKA